jgi:hypothetical protein
MSHSDHFVYRQPFTLPEVFPREDLAKRNLREDQPQRN